MGMIIKEVGIMERKQSYIPEKAHDVMRNFKLKPYGEVAKRLEVASDRTIAKYEQLLAEEKIVRQSGGDAK